MIHLVRKRGTVLCSSRMIDRCELPPQFRNAAGAAQQALGRGQPGAQKTGGRRIAAHDPHCLTNHHITLATF